MSNNQRRPTIGFLTSQITDGVGQELWKGVVEAAQALDVNLLCFPGGSLQDTLGPPNQRDVIFDLVNLMKFDGLVTWASSIIGTLNHADLEAFHLRFQVPIVSLTLPLEGAGTIAIDSYHGMSALMQHLIQHHGYRRIAFIRGPEDHPYAQERYQAYLGGLAEANIPFDPNLVTLPDMFVPAAGARGVQLLLGNRRLIPGRDFEALVTSSDRVSLGALQALQYRGLQVPHDLAVVGFNDSLEGRLCTPPLTTVAQPFYEQGWQAVELLTKILRGQAAPCQITLPACLVVRQSCGCPSPSVTLAAAPDAASVGEEGLLQWEPSPAQMQAFPLDSEYAVQLLAAIKSELIDNHPGSFLTRLESILRRAEALGEPLDTWQDQLSLLRRAACGTLTAAQNRRLSDLIAQGRVIAAEVTNRAQASHHLVTAQKANLLREIGLALIMTFDFTLLGRVLAERLPQTGIASAYVMLFENPAEPVHSLRLMLALVEGELVSLEEGGRVFTPAWLVPTDFLPSRRFTLLLQPLSFHSERLGYVAFEVGPLDGSIFQVLAGQISSAITGAQLFKQLETLATTDSLTGVHNRRNFYTLASAEVERSLRFHHPLSILMLDLDHFKQVNDRYGHLNGDRVLREVAQGCKQGLRWIDSIGRYGGEEFIILLPETDISNALVVAERLRATVAGLRVRLNSGEEAMVTISLGVTALVPENTTTLDDLLEQADTALYLAKQSGRNCARTAGAPMR